jgi:hypothetical protein
MKKEMLAFLREERSISEYKILTLERGRPKPYKARLLSIERDFLKFPFDSLGLDSLSELRSAVSAFKADRALFDSKYSSGLLRERASSPRHISSLRRRIAFFKSLYKYLLEDKIRKIDPLEGKTSISKRALSPKRPSSVRAVEGALSAKKRARIQILLYSFARIIRREALDIEATLDLLEKENGEASIELEARLDGLFDFGVINIFRYYNAGIMETPLLTNGTMGHNNYISCIYPLSDITDSLERSICIERTLPLERGFFSKAGAPINKKFVKRGFSIKLPIARVGNETMKLLYLDLFSTQRTCVTPLMEKDFYNIKIRGDYYKAISTIPVWEFPKKVVGPYLNREILRLLELEEASLIGTVDFADDQFCIAANKSSKGKIEIDPVESRILVAATRSEDSHINQAYSWIKLLIKEIKDDYEESFLRKEAVESSENRLAKYQKFLENKEYEQ